MLFGRFLMVKRTGRFTISDTNYIKQNHDKLTIDQIGKKLNRDPISIRNWIDKNIGISVLQKKEIEGGIELKSRSYYRELQKQFNSEELELFEFHFRKMWVQFKDDVFHTEEMQIVDAIKYEILMNRILTGQQDVNRSLAVLQRDIDELRKIPPDSRTRDDLDMIVNLERQMASLRSSQEIMGKEFKEYQAKKGLIIKELKGTREQRVKNIEDSKESFAKLLKRLLTNPEYRHAVGVEMETMRHAADQEYQRLTQEHVYGNGEVDRPILNIESVNFDEE